MESYQGLFVYSELMDLDESKASSRGVTSYELVTYQAGEINPTIDFNNRCDGLIEVKTILQDVPVGDSTRTPQSGIILAFQLRQLRFLYNRDVGIAGLSPIKRDASRLRHADSTVHCTA